MGIGVLHFEQGFDGAIGAVMVGLGLGELADPLAVFAVGIDIADGQRSYGLDFADAQGRPDRSGIRRDEADQHGECGYCEADTIVSGSGSAVDCAREHLFGVIRSEMRMA
jgi:hypothetical protein